VDITPEQRITNTDPKRIIDDAMQLEPAIRAFIAETLLESLDFEEDFTVSAAWQEEIQRRCAAIDNGTAQLVDHESAMAQLRASVA
jgi:putative addiction module component (TIGR02574 family)